MPTATLKPVEWIASSRRDLQAFPEAVRRKIGYALFRAQEGKTSVDRAVYTVRFARAIYVLHAFQKKSKTGIATPKHDIDLIRRRLKAAAEHYRIAYGKEPDDAESTNSNGGG